MKKLLALFLLVAATCIINAQQPHGKGKPQPQPLCTTPSGLLTSNITSSSATANWNAVSGAISYNVDYKQSSSSSWINIASGITSTSWNLSGIPASTSFNWRVRTNCSSGTSGYAQTTFSTLSDGGGSCSAPTGLTTSGITTSSATANWNPVSGAVSYNVDYKQSSSGTWINIASGITSTNWNLAGMPASTSFDWRVRTNCSSGSSGYAQTTFSTLSEGGGSCNAPTSLTTSGITTSSATATWNAVSGAVSYNVDYKQSSSGSWINIASGITTTSWNLAGMPASTSFDWRVRTNCSSGSSGYAQTTFSTLSDGGGSCSAPSGLTTSGITASSAIASWAAVSGAVSYNLDYKPASSADWVTIANGTTSLQWTIGGMNPTTTYDWRVRANCSSGNSGYTQTQFTTGAAGSCSAPGGLYASNIASSTATLNWSAVSGALVYTVEYKPVTSGTWIVATSGTYGLYVNLYSLSAGTTYDWRVYTSCSLTESSGYSYAQFTASGSTPPPPSACPGPYDVSTNETISGAAAISLNTDVKGTIASANDIDHYQFTISSAGTVSVWLTTLPANYDLAVLNSSGAEIGISQNSGSQNENISLSVNPGTYYVKVFPRGSASSATSCYNLKVQGITATRVAGSTTATKEIVDPNFKVNLYPNPAGDQLNVWVEGVERSGIKVYNLMGKLVMQQQTVNALTQLNISKLTPGFYLVKVNDGKETKSAKFIKQ